MKLLKQFLIILAISFIGEILNHIIPLPIPASIYGMVILFLALVTGAIKYDSVERAGKFLIDILPVLFIPAGVGLMASWGILRPILIPMAIVMVVSTFTVLAATGWTSQIIIRRNKKKGIKEVAERE